MAHKKKKGLKHTMSEGEIHILLGDIEEGIRQIEDSVDALPQEYSRHFSLHSPANLVEGESMESWNTRTPTNKLMLGLHGALDERFKSKKKKGRKLI